MDNSATPDPRQGWNDSVRIREVGGPPGGEKERFAPEADDGAAGIEIRPPRRSRPFQAAWILTGILIGIGLLWIGGAFESATTFGYSYSVDPETGQQIPPDMPPLTVQLRNIGYAAPTMLQTGVASAAALLILQGLRRAREHQPAPDRTQ